MIVSLFLPERIGNYFLLRKKVVSIQITQEALLATAMILSGTSRTVTGVFEEPIEQEGTRHEEIVAALTRLKEHLDSSAQIVCILSSAQVIFKEITLPFVGAKKVQLVVPFEVEPLLPFNLEQGLIGSIITKEDAQQTEVLVAAIKKEVRDQYVGYFSDAGLTLQKLTVDMFELYGVLTEQQQLGTSALIDIGRTQSHLALVIEGTLQYIRSFPEGTSQPLEPLVDRIGQTADTVLQKYQTSRSANYVTGAVTENSVVSLEGLFSLPTVVIHPQDLTGITMKIDVPGRYMLSLAAAASPQITDSFTLLQEKAEAEETKRITRQIVVAGILLLASFITFSVYSFLRVRTLRQAYKAGEKEAISELQRHFNLKPAQVRDITSANNAARAELNKQETAWRRISPDNRYAYLKYLAALTKCINKEESRVTFDSIILKDDIIKLYGSVPEYHNLPKLQKQLECKFFSKVAKLQDPNFRTEPITLTVNPEEF